MKLLIVGATGSAGRCVTERALARGHNVTAFVRRPSLPAQERLRTIVGDPRRVEDLLAALPGHDAAISCLGNPSPADQGLVTASATAMVEAMDKLNMRRYLVLSGALLFPTLHPVLFLLRVVMAGKLADARAMEQVIRASDLDWTIARPPNLKHGNRAVGYQAKADGRPTRKWSAMQFTDLADFLLDAVEDRQFIRKIVGVGPS